MKIRLIILLAAVLMIVAPNAVLGQVCGDFTNDGYANVSDMTAYVDFIWKGGPPPVNYADADIDDYEVP